LRENPQISGEIEAAIRQNAGLVQEQMLDNVIADEDDK
jgi:recombination protein RecA